MTDEEAAVLNVDLLEVLQDIVLEQACDLLMEQRCPIDRLHTLQHFAFDSTWLHWEECPDGHTWPLKSIGRDDYVPDRDAVADKLQEYTP